MKKFCAFILLAAGVFASQPWDKPAASWSDDDRTLLLNRSPWALQVNAVMNDPEDEIEPAPPGPPDTVSPMPGNVSQQRKRWNGEIGKNRMGKPATVPVLVRWESALPVRAAQKETQAADDAYVISVSGLIPAGKYRSQGRTETTSSSKDNSDPENPEEVLEAFMAYSVLSANQGEVHPANVKLDGKSGMVRIYFPRDLVMDRAVKEAMFRTRFGGLNVKATFRISSMKYQGKIEL